MLSFSPTFTPISSIDPAELLQVHPGFRRQRLDPGPGLGHLVEAHAPGLGTVGDRDQLVDELARLLRGARKHFLHLADQLHLVQRATFEAGDRGLQLLGLRPGDLAGQDAARPEAAADVGAAGATDQQAGAGGALDLLDQRLKRPLRFLGCDLRVDQILPDLHGAQALSRAGQPLVSLHDLVGRQRTVAERPVRLIECGLQVLGRLLSDREAVLAEPQQSRNAKSAAGDDRPDDRALRPEGPGDLRPLLSDDS